VTDNGVMVGALCLARRRVQPFALEDVLILQAVAKRASRLIQRLNAGEADPFSDYPLIVTGAALQTEIFHLLVEMELRLASLCHDSVELALVEITAPISPAAILAAQRAGDPVRWAIGEESTRRVALFKRAADAGEVARQIETAIAALRASLPLSGAGTVAVQEDVVSSVDASILFQLADRALTTCGGTDRREDLLLGSAPTPAPS
jgi:hypothetical protein